MSSTPISRLIVREDKPPAGPATVYEFDDAGHIIRQTEQYADGSKSEKTYQYTNGNVVQRDVLLTNAAGQKTGRTRDKYEYDMFQNPLFGMLEQSALIEVPTYASKNNPIRWTSQTLSPSDATVIIATVDYTYTYNYNASGLPTVYQAGTTIGSYTYAN